VFEVLDATEEVQNNIISFEIIKSLTVQKLEELSKAI